MFNRKYKVWEPDIKVGDKVIMFRQERFFGMNDQMHDWLREGTVLKVSHIADCGELFEDGYQEVSLECHEYGSKKRVWSLHPTHVMKVGDANE